MRDGVTCENRRNRHIHSKVDVEEEAESEAEGWEELQASQQDPR